jgi:hypothetical protein
MVTIYTDYSGDDIASLPGMTPVSKRLGSPSPVAGLALT